MCKGTLAEKELGENRTEERDGVRHSWFRLVKA